MTYTNIILAAAKTAKISGSLLLAICTHESSLKNELVLHDGGSPSYGICQLKKGTAEMLGFHGNSVDLMNPATNARYAASYLKYQLNRYNQNYCKAAAAYNSGTYNESKTAPGNPKNYRYIQYIKQHMSQEMRDQMSCSE